MTSVWRPEAESGGVQVASMCGPPNMDGYSNSGIFSLLEDNLQTPTAQQPAFRFVLEKRMPTGSSTPKALSQGRPSNLMQRLLDLTEKRLLAKLALSSRSAEQVFKQVIKVCEAVGPQKSCRRDHSLVS